MTAADFAFLPHHMHLAARRAARNMSLPLVCFTLMLMGCSQQEFRPPSGYALIASLRVTEDAFEGPTKRKSGTDFYLDKGSKDSGPSLLVYSFVNGRLAETLGGGIAPSQLDSLLAAMPERPFDFAQRVSDVDARLRKEARSHGRPHEPPITLDGWKLRAFILTKHGPMEFTEWNPGPVLSFYARHDILIRSLDAYLDALATFYGRSSFGL